MEIINKINNEIEENPFLKKDFDHEPTAGFDGTDLLENLPNELTLQQHLKNQLQDIKLSNAEIKIAIVIIQSLEENGLLHEDLDEIEETMDYAYSIKEIKDVLHNVIQELDPSGIGARNFKETIYIQLKKKATSKGRIRKLTNKILFDPQFSSFEDAKAHLATHYSEYSIESVT